MEHRREVVVEGVARAFVDVALDLLAAGGHRGDAVDLLARDERVGTAELQQGRAGVRAHLAAVNLDVLGAGQRRHRAAGF
ncbi:MAG: hypothetical protein QOI48_4206 [Solirubrobacteraceae bacterium]|jgi:hypothetical protein|nr:hypothetical protein [Solirubrobacteraceae bacterium]